MYVLTVLFTVFFIHIWTPWHLQRILTWFGTYLDIYCARWTESWGYLFFFNLKKVNQEGAHVSRGKDNRLPYKYRFEGNSILSQKIHSTHGKKSDQTISCHNGFSQTMSVKASESYDSVSKADPGLELGEIIARVHSVRSESRFSCGFVCLYLSICKLSCYSLVSPFVVFY